MKTNVTAGETPEQITVSMIDQDLKDGISKPEMAIKYGIKPWEVDEMFKHPFLKGRRPSRKKTLSFSFIDDTEPLNNSDIAVEQVEEVDPNQITLEQAIDEAIDSVEDAKEQMHQTQEAIVEMLSPTKFETSEDAIKNFDNEEDDEYISDEITEEIQIEDEDDDSFEL